jgi:hypothetical protein
MISEAKKYLQQPDRLSAQAGLLRDKDSLILFRR